MNSFFRNTTTVLLLGCAGLAHAAPLDPSVIRQAVREAVQETMRSEGTAAAGKRQGTAIAAPQAAASSDDIGARRSGILGERGQDSCLLNFGVNGTLGGPALSSHVLGRTQVWRDK